MQKYACNNCGNTFVMGSSAHINCPACGSNSTTEIGESSKKSIWQNKIVVISIASVFLMLIILFLLPRSSNSFDVILEKYPDKCMFKIVIKDGSRIANADKFKYSDDNGKTWQMLNEFKAELNGTFTAKVMHREDSSKKFIYKFNNPFAFNPTCKNLLADPCDCKKLQILSIEVKELNNHQALIIHASQSKCPKEYSVTGLKGDFQSDSIFIITNKTEFDVYIKSSKCEPVSYAMNPYHVAPASANMVSASELTRQIRRFILAPDNKLMYAIIDMFESTSVKVCVNNNLQNQPTIYEYLQRLKTLGSSNGVVVKVEKAKYNSSNKISQLSLFEKQQDE
jgi:RNA polymerase subunit RPABC4/transcription elongation factor Spt4